MNCSKCRWFKPHPESFFKLKEMLSGHAACGADSRKDGDCTVWPVSVPAEKDGACSLMESADKQLFNQPPMKLHYSQSAGRWCIGGKELHCGQIVKIKATNTTGREFWIFGRFEIAGQNNPVFYTTFGRVVPELAETIFEL